MGLFGNQSFSATGATLALPEPLPRKKTVHRKSLSLLWRAHLGGITSSPSCRSFTRGALSSAFGILAIADKWANRFQEGKLNRLPILPHMEPDRGVLVWTMFHLKGPGPERQVPCEKGGRVGG